MHNRWVHLALAVASALGTAACGDDGSDGRDTTTSPATAPSLPTVEPANFVTGIDHPYLPLRVGARWTYSNGDERIEVVVLPDQRTVMGVPVVVVRDTVTVDGELVEDTFDWFAQDVEGNVWYMGEESTEYEGGVAVSTHGSWEAGVDGARPGILMPATFVVGQVYQQEYDPGVAQDVGQVVRVGETVTVNGVEYTDVVVFREWNPLEPQAAHEEKYYAPGVGLVLAVAVDGSEREELVEHQPG
jgi:hypothetical protein